MTSDSLISELDRLEAVTAPWQVNPGDVEDALVRATRSEYIQWFSKAQQFVPAEKIAIFRDAYEGTILTSRIKAFLTDPLAISPFYDENNPTPLIPKWQSPHTTTFVASAVIQRTILLEALASTKPVEEALNQLAEFMTRVPSAIPLLNRLGVPQIANEDDLQKMLLPFLRILYSDVRREDYVSQFGGRKSRVDFLLREEGIVIETKMTRESLTDKDVGAELLVDWGRYSKHPDCRAIYALVYDPGKLLDNPTALIHDLSNAGMAVPVKVSVIH